MLKSKFFCVAVAGLTATDGRTIEESWVNDIAAGYNRATYGARLNMEHIRGYSAEPPFNAYGDVLSVKKDFVTIELNGKAEQRLALFAEIQPTPELVAMTKKAQKIYTSIEVAPNFAGTGKANLVGLAVTDSPASLGTDILSFSTTKDNAAAQQLRDAFNAKKQDPANFLSAAYETKIEFEDDAGSQSQPSALEKLADAIMARFGKEPEQKAPEPKTPEPAQQLGDQTVAIAGMFKDLTTALSADRKADQQAMSDRFAKIESDFSTLKTELETTPSARHSSRPIAPGGAGRVLADC